MVVDSRSLGSRWQIGPLDESKRGQSHLVSLSDTFNDHHLIVVIRTNGDRRWLPGVAITHKAGEEPEKFFVSGGFAFTDAEKTEVSALEAVKLEDIDEAKVRAEYAAASKGDDDDSKAAADAAKAMAAAIGVQL